MDKIKRNIIRIIYSYLFKDNVKCAKKLGVKIGDNCRILDESGAVFGTEPWLVTVGNHVEITHGVKILTHKGDLWVLRELSREYEKKDLFSPVIIGNNVMIGMNSVIMPGITIGSNVIIGVHSVVTKDIPDNTIVAGVPAKKISTIKDYMNKLNNNDYLVNTKDMNQKQKYKYLKENFPKWFE